MTTFQILANIEDSLLKSMTPTERTIRRNKWNKLERKANEAFTATKIDIVTLTQLAQSGELRPTFQPTIDRMLQHQDCRA